MERTIRVLVEATHEVHTFTTEATTLGELKNDFIERGIPFNNDSEFHEARSGASYLRDDAPLPSNIPWKGDVTNDLTFKIVTAKRKIESGVDIERSALYSKIRELDVASDIKECYDKNFTNCSNDELYAFIEAWEKSNDEDAIFDDKGNEYEKELDDDLESFDFEALLNYLIGYHDMDIIDAVDVANYISNQLYGHDYEEAVKSDKKDEYSLIDEEFNF